MHPGTELARAQLGKVDAYLRGRRLRLPDVNSRGSGAAMQLIPISDAIFEADSAPSGGGSGVGTVEHALHLLRGLTPLCLLRVHNILKRPEICVVTLIPVPWFPYQKVPVDYVVRGVGHFDDHECEDCLRRMGPAGRSGRKEKELCCCERCGDTIRDWPGCKSLEPQNDEPLCWNLLKPALISLVHRVPELSRMAPAHGTYSSVVNHRASGDGAPGTNPSLPGGYDIKYAEENRAHAEPCFAAYLRVEFLDRPAEQSFNLAVTMVDYST